MKKLQELTRAQRSNEPAGRAVNGQFWARSRNSNCFLVAGVWAFFAASVSAQDGGVEPKRYELKPPPRLDLLPNLSASVEIRPWQPDVMRGVQLVLEITNIGSGPVELLDPIERTNVYLLSQRDKPSGRYVSLPNIYGERMEAEELRRFPEAYARVIAEIETRRSFEILDESPGRQAPKVKGIHDVVDHYVRLEAGERLRWRVRFTRIMADPEKYWTERYKPSAPLPAGDNTPSPYEPMTHPRAVPIPPGAYQVGVLLLLDTRENGAERTGVGSTRETKWPLITVQLGPKAKDGG